MKQKNKYGVSAETNPARIAAEPLPKEFVAGAISFSGSFFEINTPRLHQFGFQMKMGSEYQKIINQIAATLQVPNRAVVYHDRRGHDFALLLIRSNRELVEKVIPFMNEHLVGPKLKSYHLWKNNLLIHCKLSE